MIDTHAQTRSAHFGTMPGGQSVEAWTLKGAGGLELEILTLGGIVRLLAAPDRNGSFADLVLGYPDLKPYLENPAYFGATIGRVAGRIAGGTLKFGSEVFQLPVNNPPNHLHGGPGALHTRVWKAEPVERPDGAPSLNLSYHSPDGEQGYPGNLHIAVVYTVTAANEFVFETFVESDRATPASITHHSYFNMRGQGNGTILDHRAQIYSSQIIPCDKAMTLLNRLEPVEGRSADMRTPVRLGTVIPSLWQNHGDLYWIVNDKTLRQAARIYVAIYAAVIALSVYTGSILPILLVGGCNLFGAWLMPIYGDTQHAGLAKNVLDHRLNCRAVYMNPIHRFLYWNMNYHVEHHMFPLVPYHALPKLHDAVKDDMPEPYPSLFAAWKEIIPAVLKQVKDPTYHVKRKLPPPKGHPEESGHRSDASPDATGWLEICAGADLGPEDVIRFDHGKRTFALCRDAEERIDFTPGDYIQLDIPAYDQIRFRDFDIPEPYASVWERQHVFDLTVGNPETGRRNNYSIASNLRTERQLRFNVRIATPPPGQDCPPGSVPATSSASNRAIP